MKIADIFEVDQISFVEPSFSDLPYIEMNDLFLGDGFVKGKILIDGEDNPLGFAGCDKDGDWYGACYHLRHPPVTLLNQFESIPYDLYQESGQVWADAVREYYNTRMQETADPYPEDLNPSRLEIVSDIIQNYSGDSDITCLDCCCGTGIGSYAMRQAGLNPLSYDNDETLLVRGLKEGRLLPERTMWIDGRLVDHYLENPVDIAFGFMLGEIQTFNEEIWSSLISALCSVSKRAVLTVGTETEANQIKTLIHESGLSAEIYENDRDPLYDRWICVISD